MTLSAGCRSDWGKNHRVEFVVVAAVVRNDDGVAAFRHLQGVARIPQGSCNLNRNTDVHPTLRTYVSSYTNNRLSLMQQHKSKKNAG